MTDPNAAIPQAWIRDYVDQILVLASKFESGPMQDAAAMRAEHAMDLVKAFRESAELVDRGPA